MNDNDRRGFRVLIAPDSFKGSLSSEAAVEAIAEGIRRACPEAVIDGLPIADGGEGTTDTLVRATAGEKRYITVTGPLNEPVDSFYGLIIKTGDDRDPPHPFPPSPSLPLSPSPPLPLLSTASVVEAAAACGLTQVPPERRDPRVTTSRGLGELMLAAIRSRPQRLIVGIGGSATNDGGAGMLRALGLRFLDAGGRDLPEGGAALARLARIDRSGWRWPADAPEVWVASDVTNPLCGESGASAVFGPQKGATPETVRDLDAALARYARVCAETLGLDASTRPGAGAAGGIGFALQAFLSATVRSGVEIVLETAGFADRAGRADLVVTGEGRLDSQTASGKAVLGVARAGKTARRPVVALVGSIEGDVRSLRDEGLLAAMSVATGPAALDDLMRNARNLLADAAERMTDWLLTGQLLALAHRGDAEERREKTI